MTKFKSATIALLAFAAFTILAGPAAAKDRNSDGLPDRWEKRHHLSLKVHQAKRDQDRDGLRNKAEFKADTDPRDDDTDGDGIEDGDENAGTIESYDAATKKLTIKLFDGNIVSGFVTDQTEITCEVAGATDSSHDDEDSAPGDEEEDGDRDEDEDGDRDEDEDEDEDGDHGNRGDGDTACGTEALTTGREVEEADLKLADGKATFEEIELAPAPAA